MGTGSNHDSMISSDYLAIAKEMVSEICDEADLDSVRALILLVSDLVLCKIIMLTFLQGISPTSTLFLQ